MKKYGIIIGLAFFSLAIFEFSKATPESVVYWEKRGDVAAAKKNDAGALVAWLRAERAAGLIDRLRLVQKRLALPVCSKDVSKKSYVMHIHEIAQACVASVPLFLLQLLMLLLLLFVAYLLGSVGFHRFFHEYVGIIFALCLMAGTMFLAKERDAMMPGVLMKPSVVLTSGPGESFPIVTTLAGPDVLNVLQAANAHVKVAKKGLCGWVAATALEVV